MAKILVADDSEDILGYMRLALTATHHQVILARNGQEAVELARRESPDLIFMDLMMPVMGGVEAARTLRDGIATRDIPIVAISARNPSGEANQYFDLFMPKPCRFVEIVGIVNTICRRLVAAAC